MEMAIVVTIAGIIATVAMVNYSTTIEKFRAREGEEILIALFGAQKRYALDHGGTYTNNFANLDVEPRESPYFGIPVVGTVVLVQVTRVGAPTTYSLSINSLGVITCASAGTICQKLGY